MTTKTHHSLVKKFLIIALLVPFFNFPVLAQTYTHEFVNPDGSSYICSSTLAGSSSRSGCAKVSIEERIKHQKKLLQRADQSATCSEKLLGKTYGDAGSRISRYLSADYLENPDPPFSFEMYRKCMGL